MRADANYYFVQGNVLYAWSIVRDSNGDLADPVDIRLRIKHRGDTDVVIETGILTHESVGRYSHEFTLADHGTYILRWESDTPTGATEETVHVARTAFV